MEKYELITRGDIAATQSFVKRAKVSAFFDSCWEKLIYLFTILSALMIVLIFIFILSKSWNIFAVNGFGLFTKTGFEEQIRNAYHASADQPVWEFGFLSLIIGTLATTLGALVIAIPAGVGTAVIIAEMSWGWRKRFLESSVRLLASIPSVIYGLVGLMVMVPFIKQHLLTVDMQIKYLKYFQLTGRSMLAGIIVLSFMIVPMIIALSVDAINAVPKRYREASLALGLTKWRTITQVVIPAAKSGILAGIILATGRGIGEAIALSMVSGGIAVLPKLSHGFVFLFTPVLPLASAIVNKSQAIAVPSIEAALFACGVVLLIICALLSICTRIVETIVRRRQGLEE
ncbi:MAG: phosphate ABC transporter permease subunit PstC [Peptococcaceae bacterium]